LRRAARWRVPLLVFVLALLATGSAALYLIRLFQHNDAVAFEHEAARTHQAMQERVDLTITLLRGAAGLLEADDELQWDQFNVYIGRLQLRRFYPGVLGIGFSRTLPAAQVPALQARMQAAVPGFHVWPPTSAERVHSVVFLQPLDERNRAALGYDMSTEPVRRAAMEQARDSGAPAASGRVQLVQEIYEDKQSGFLIYVPLYDGGGVPATLAARRSELRGFVYSPLRIGDLFRGARGNGPREIDYAAYDGLAADPRSLLRDTAPDRGRAAPRFVIDHRLHVAGREWLVRFSSRPEFDARSPLRFAPLLLFAAIGVSGLLAGISLLQVRAREAAETLAEAALRNAHLYEELAEAGRRKDEFLAMLGHELRNPLAPIVSGVAALQRGVAPERATRLHEVIARQAAQLTRLVNDLLEASRITTGRIAIQRATMQADESVQRAVEAMQPQLQQRGQTLTIERRGTPAPLHGDAARIAQVLVNLLHNASKFSADGATLTLRIDEQPEGVSFDVIDPGIGLAPHALSRVFELFVQGAGDDGHGGLGVGLALVRRLVELHGGRVSAHSDGLGQGTHFMVWLPRDGPAIVD
jgi:signal transduction histidine kinase